MGALAMLVIASPTARRAEAAASSSATGVRSPMAIASPVKTSKLVAVTAASATGTCQGPTIWSRADEAVDRAVADGDEEGLVGHGGQAQHARDGLAQVDAARSRTAAARRGARLTSRTILGGLPSSTASGMSMGWLPKCGSVDHAACRRRWRCPTHGEGAALAPAQRLERVEPVGGDGQHVALLRLVAPDLERRHAGLVVRDLAQLEARAAPAVVDQLGQRVGQAARADVVDGDDRVVVAERPAAVDDLLAAALHLGVVALHRGEIEILLRGARGHRRGRAAAEADEHGRAAEHDDGRARRDLALLDQWPARMLPRPPAIMMGLW